MIIKASVFLPSCHPGMSDISSATPQAFISVDMQNSICAIHKRALELKAELGKLRRLHMTNQESMRDSMQKTFDKIKVFKYAVFNLSA